MKNSKLVLFVAAGLLLTVFVLIGIQPMPVAGRKRLNEDNAVKHHTSSLGRHDIPVALETKVRDNQWSNRTPIAGVNLQEKGDNPQNSSLEHGANTELPAVKSVVVKRGNMTNDNRGDKERETTAFISAARSALEKKNVPVAGRRSSVECTNDEVVVTFYPKEGERAGSFIVRMDRRTGAILDTKIWR
ncbi:MAG: hypothetical protein WCO77_13315 [bacterium]